MSRSAIIVFILILSCIWTSKKVIAELVMTKSFPTCMQKYTDTITAAPVTNPAGRIEEFTKDNKLFYTVISPNKNRTYYDAQCQAFCTNDNALVESNKIKSCTEGLLYLGLMKVDVVWKDSRKWELKEEMPACLSAKIASQENISIMDPDGLNTHVPKDFQYVTKYVYKDKPVYELGRNICADCGNKVITENCEDLCTPLNNFHDRKDPRCPDFMKTAKPVETIWPNYSEQ